MPILPTSPYQPILTLFQKPRDVKKMSIFAAALVLVVVMLFFVVRSPGAWAIEVNKKVVAVVKDKGEASAILEKLVKERSSQFGRPVNLMGSVTFHRVKPEEGQLLQGEALKDVLEKAVAFSTDGVAVKINGEVKLAVKDMQTGRALLEKLKGQYRQAGDTRLDFAENVELVKEPVLAGEILNLDKAMKVVTQGGQEVQTYKVKEGDTLWDIASATKMSIEKLQAANPGLTPENLQIGQEVRLNKTVPLINVVATSKLLTIETIPFDTEEKRSNNLYLGEQKVVQEGKSGKKEVTYEITRRNGVVVGRKAVEGKVLEPAQTKVVAKGSRTLLASRSGGSGRLAYPTVGSIVSPFGSRSGRMHEGVDIAANTGAPVVAAESGRVISAGWNGGYGKCVEISHGDGVVTRYAHLSSFNVSVGQQVVRGQLIGRVGNTGRSTGPHLHFEVLVNGTPHNPSKFI